MVQEEVIIEFSSNTNKVENSGDKLVQVLEQISNNLEEANVDFKSLNSSISETANRMNNASNKGSKSTLGWAGSFAKLTSFATIAFKKISDWTAESAAFIGTQTRFNAVFDKTNGELQEATRWVKEYSNALLLDNKEVMNSVATFRILTRNMGINNEESIKMSKNLTQVAYDLAAVRGEYEDVSIAMTAITSGLGGEAEAMKKYGVYLNQATLQATLYEAGINRTVSSLNAAERAQLIYYQIMKTTAGQQGYYAKTLLSPANALNIIKTQFTLLAREIGNVFIPILTAAVPIIVALTNALRNLAKSIANFFGIEIDFDAYSEGIGNIAGGIDGIGNSADGASKKMKNMLRDFDELHVVNFDEPTGSGSGAGGGTGSGNLNLPEIEYKGFEGALDRVKEKLAGISDYIKAIGIALAGWFISSKVLKFFNDLFGWKLNGAQILIKGLGVGLMLGGAYLTYKGITKILNDGLSWENVLEVLTGVGSIFGGALLLTGGKLQLSLALTLGITSIMGLFEGNKKMLNGDLSWSSLMTAIGGSFGLALATLIATKSWEIAGLVLVLGLTISFFIKAIEYFNLNKYSKGAGAQAAKSMKNGFEIELANGEKQTTEVIDGYWANVTKSSGDKLGALQLSISNGIGNINSTISGLDTSEVNNKFDLMQQSGQNAMIGINDATNTNFNNIRETIKNNMAESEKITNETLTNMSNDTVTKTTQILTQGKTTFHNLQQSIDSEMKNAQKAVSDNTDLMSSSAKDMADNIDKYSTNSKNSLESISKMQLKLPHFKVDWDGNGFAGQLLQKIGFPGFPLIGVDWYMNGGFPTKGDLFIANEREPELIGSMGNRSVVANNTQITEGIADASYYGMRKALKEVDFGGDTAIYIGNRQITDYVVKQKKMDDKRYGR